jgi:hypothetical protein
VDDRARILDLQRTFVTPPGLRRSRPRDVVLTAGGRALYAAGFILLAAAIVAGVALYLAAQRQSAERQAFDRDSVTTSAFVTRLWRGSGDPKPAMVAYRFEAAGAVYEGQSKIRLSAWRALEHGGAIEVRYLPDHPGRSLVAGAERGGLPPWIAFLVAAGLAAGGALCLAGLNGQRRLLMDGRAAPALVTAIVKHSSSHGGSHRSIKYTFPLMSGSIATGKSEAPRKPPAVGSVICIVYDPDRPGRSRPYPFPLVRL